MTTTCLTDVILGRSGLRRRLTEQEFIHLYERCGRSLQAYVVRVTGDASLGEDIFQEAFYRLWRTPLPEMEPGKLQAYAYRVATRLICDSWRRRREEVAEDWESMPAPDLHLEQDWEIQELFQQLKARQRALLWLAYVEGCDHREIAERLGLVSASVRVLLFRARQKFSQLLIRKGLSWEDLS